MSSSHTSEQAGDDVRLDERSLHLRRQILRALEAGDRGHLGASMSLVEILRVLYDDVLRHDPARPRWPGRDRLVLSKGHGCLALYALLADKGYFPEEELWRFCKPEGILGGHPEYGKVPGVEVSTGSLGHGLPFGIGFALNARMERSGARVFVVLGDGECNEGSVWEGALCAGKHRLEDLTVVVDYNKQQSFGPLAEVQPMEPMAAKWRDFGFATREVDGHDVGQLRDALGEVPLEQGRPGALICHTIKGKGIPPAEQNPTWHHRSHIPADEMARLMAFLEPA